MSNINLMNIIHSIFDQKFLLIVPIIDICNKINIYLSKVEDI